MTDRLERARVFFDAIETGKGWQGCQEHCHPDATFSAQATALEGVQTLEAYAEWMKGMFTPAPDGRYELKFFAEDADRACVAGVGVFHATHTGPGGPVEPTGKKVAAEFTYVMEFEGAKIRHMTKIWNDGVSLGMLGWL